MEHHNADVDNMLRNAIARKNIIKFTYQGRQRIAEPHVYGVHSGRKQLLVYQIGGDSTTGDLPNWRRFNVDEISSIQIASQSFNVRQSLLSGKHSVFDEILAIAAIRDEIAE